MKLFHVTRQPWDRHYTGMSAWQWKIEPTGRNRWLTFDIYRQRDQNTRKFRMFRIGGYHWIAGVMADSADPLRVFVHPPGLGWLNFEFGWQGRSKSGVSYKNASQRNSRMRVNLFGLYVEFETPGRLRKRVCAKEDRDWQAMAEYYDRFYDSQYTTSDDKQ